MKVKLAIISLTIPSVQAMTLTLFGGTNDTPRKFSIDEVTQRCYSINSCFGGPNTSATWYGVKSKTKVVFYSHESCQTHQAIGYETPEGALYFSDAKFTQSVAAFMIWETGQYATSGLENACYLDESSKVNTTNQVAA